jgi:catechol-2,3-dioxygenase
MSLQIIGDDAMSQRRATLKGVAEVVLNAKDIGKMRQFYQDVVGLEFHSQAPAENPTIVFLKIVDIDSPLGRGGHPQLFALIDPYRHPPARKRFQGLDVTLSTFNHLAFEISLDDLEAEKRRLESLGVTVHTEQFPAMQALALFFNDPEGNVIEFICHDGSLGR